MLWNHCVISPLFKLHLKNTKAQFLLKQNAINYKITNKEKRQVNIISFTSTRPSPAGTLLAAAAAAAPSQEAEAD